MINPQKEAAKHIAKELLTFAICDELENWHTKGTEFFGRTPLSESEQARVNKELTRISKKLFRAIQND